MNEATKKIYTCGDCHQTFTRGRGRPPKNPTCQDCQQSNDKHEQSIKARITKAPKSDKPKKATIASKVKIRAITPEISDEPSIKSPAMPKDNRPTIHGATGTAVTSPCPVCSYAYADGGYCQSCGWHKPIVRVPYGTASGKVGRK